MNETEILEYQHTRIDSSKCRDVEAEEFKKFSFAEGLDLDRNRNRWQGLFVLLCMIASSIITYRYFSRHPEDVMGRVDLAALAGVVPGMIIGTFLSGLVLMFLPPKPVRLSREEYQKLHARIDRNMTISGLLWLLDLILIFVFNSQYGEAFGDTGVFFGFLLIFAFPGLCAYTKGLGCELRNWKCFHCDGKMEGEWPVCPHCQFDMSTGKISSKDAVNIVD